MREAGDFRSVYIEHLITSCNGNIEDPNAVDNLLLELEGSPKPVYLKRAIEVLLTLSVESVSRTSSHDTNGLDGISDLLGYNGTIDELNYSKSYEQPVHERSLALLDTYEAEGGRISAEVREIFLNFLQLKTSKRVLRAKLGVNYDIMLHFKILSNSIDEPLAPEVIDIDEEGTEIVREEDDTGNKRDIISDSEEEMEILSQPSIKRELKRFKQSSPPKQVVNVGADEVTGSLFENLPHLTPSREPLPVPVEPLIKTKGKKKAKSWQPMTLDDAPKPKPKLTVFGEDLLTWKLNPSNLDQLYDFWKLLQWCFNAPSPNIFANYERILKWMVRVFRNDFAEAGNGIDRAELTQECTSESGYLLTNLIRQLGSENNWNDRIIEYSMLGLATASKVSPCYKSERSVKHHKFTEMAKVKSFNLRLRILTLYYKYLHCINKVVQRSEFIDMLGDCVYSLPFAQFQSFFTASYLMQDDCLQSFIKLLVKQILLSKFNISKTRLHYNIFYKSTSLKQEFEKWDDVQTVEEFIRKWKIFKFLVLLHIVLGDKRSNKHLVKLPSDIDGASTEIANEYIAEKWNEHPAVFSL